MKFTIEGFSQKKLVEFGLDEKDALILRWFVDFSATGKMKKLPYSTENYYLVNYQAILNDLPIISINSIQGIAKRFDKYVVIGLLQKVVKTGNGKGGKTVYFSFSNKIEELLFDNNTSNEENINNSTSTMNKNNNINNDYQKREIKTNKTFNNKINQNKENFTEIPISTSLNDTEIPISTSLNDTEIPISTSLNDTEIPFTYINSSININSSTNSFLNSSINIVPQDEFKINKYKFKIPKQEEFNDFCKKNNIFCVEYFNFCNWYEQKGKVDWKRILFTWEKNEKQKSNFSKKLIKPSYLDDVELIYRTC